MMRTRKTGEMAVLVCILLAGWTGLASAGEAADVGERNFAAEPFPGIDYGWRFTV